MARPFAALARWLAATLRPLGPCGQSGVIVGMLVGGLLVIHDVIEDGIELGPGDFIAYWIALGAFGWLVLIAIFTLFVRWPLGSIVVPTFVNAALVSGLTLAVVAAGHLYPVGFFVGLLVGLLVGALLCAVGRWLKGSDHGLY